MTIKQQSEFVSANGSVNTTKAIRAGHEARSEALREMYATLRSMVERMFRINSTQA